MGNSPRVVHREASTAPAMPRNLPRSGRSGLPGADELEVLRRLRASSDVQVLLVTATGPPHVNGLRPLGCSGDFLTNR
jgi:hypothetical protein